MSESAGAFTTSSPIDVQPYRRKGAANLSEPSRTTIHRWWPFVLLLLAGAVRWIVAAAHPEADSTLASEALGCAWAAALSLLFFIRQPRHTTPQQPPSKSSAIRCLLAGAMFIGGPAVALLIRGREFDAGSLTIALTLTPVIIAIAASALGAGRSEGIAGRLWPGLAAVAGLLLVLAQPRLGDARSDLALILAPALTGVGAALFCLDQPRPALRTTIALVGATALFSLALAEVFLVSGTRPSISLLAVACDGTLALLGVITLAQLGATRWASQFIWIPLLIVMEGIVLVRPRLTPYWIAGILLLSIASIYLLLPQNDEANSETSSVLG